MPTFIVPVEAAATMLILFIPRGTKARTLTTKETSAWSDWALTREFESDHRTGSVGWPVASEVLAI